MHHRWLMMATVEATWKEGHKSSSVCWWCNTFSGELGLQAYTGTYPDQLARWSFNLHEHTLILWSFTESLKSGREPREEIQGWDSTCAAVHRCMGSTCSMRRTRSLAEGDTESQLPPLRGIFPSPILARICLGVSSGPVANGVHLHISGGERTII